MSETALEIFSVQKMYRTNEWYSTNEWANECGQNIYWVIVEWKRMNKQENEILNANERLNEWMNERMNEWMT